MQITHVYKKKTHARIAFRREKLQQLSCELKLFPTLAIFPLTLNIVPLPVASTQKAPDPPRHGMWWDSPGHIPRQNAPAPPSCQPPPLRCVSSSILISAFSF